MLRIRRHVPVAAALVCICGCSWSVAVDPTAEAKRKPILAAAMNCDIDALRQHVGEMNEADGQGSRALEYAVLYRCTEGVNILLDAGNDPNGGPALPIAAGKGNVEVVRKLLDHGARIEAAGTMVPPLHSAAMSGNVQVVALLLERGARIDSRATGGFTPLHYGARHPALTAYLIEHGADVNAASQDGTMPLAWAHGSGIQPERSRAGESVRLLIGKGAQVNAANRQGQTALMSAALGADPDAVDALIQAGAEINARDSNGRTALGWARVNLDQGGLAWRLLSVISSELRRERANYSEVQRLLTTAGGRT